MNPYQPPKSLVAKTEEHFPWLTRELRRALIVPPLLVAPVALVLALVAGSLESTRDVFFSVVGGSPTWILAVTAVACVAQLTYGVVCYSLLRRMRMLNLPAILVASLAPIAAAGVAFAKTETDVFGVALYACLALVVGGSSWYFAVWRNERRAL